MTEEPLSTNYMPYIVYNMYQRPCNCVNLCHLYIQSALIENDMLNIHPLYTAAVGTHASVVLYC